MTVDLSRAVWRKSSRSGTQGGNCVEVADLDGAVGVRDSKDPTGPALIFSPTAWGDFLDGVDNGEFELP